MYQGRTEFSCNLSSAGYIGKMMGFFSGQLPSPSRYTEKRPQPRSSNLKTYSSGSILWEHEQRSSEERAQKCQKVSVRHISCLCPSLFEREGEDF